MMIPTWSVWWVERLVDAAAAVTVLLVVAAGLARLTRGRTSASWRAQVWTTALGAVVLLSLAVGVVEQTRLAWLPALDQVASPRQEAKARIHRTLVYLRSHPEAGSTGDQALAATARPVPVLVERWATRAVMLWVAGVLLVLSWTGVARWRAFRLARQARPADAGWQRLADDLARTLGLRQPPEVRQSDRVPTAVVIGLRHPTVVLPAQATTWTADRRRMVLLHEFAHVQRADLGLDGVTALATALHWYHPLVWWAATAWRVERERACDDAVIRAGTPASAYATVLLEIGVDLMTSRSWLPGARSVSAGSHLKDRLLALLDPRLVRRRLSARAAATTAAVGLAFGLPLSTVTLWHAGATPETIVVSLDERPVNQIVDQLGSDDAALRVAALEALRTQSRKRFPDLVQAALKHPLEHVCTSALDELAARDARMVADLVKEHASDGRPLVAARVAAAIRRWGDSAENEMNALGYTLLRAGRVDDAIAVFALNAQAFPDSSNVHDSLGEAHLAAGDPTRATACYRRSLALNPWGEHAREVLSRIETSSR